MIVEFPNLDNATTGKGQFLSRLFPELKKLGVKCVDAPQKGVDLKIHLVNIKEPCSGKNIIRLDGVNVGIGTRPGNVLMAKSYEKADGIVYQSKFSKRCCEKFLERDLSVKKRDKCVTQIIGNGASPSFYQELDGFELENKYNILCSSRWRPHKRLDQMIESFLLMEDEEVDLIVTGEVKNKVKHPRIKYVGRLDAVELGRYYRACDLFLFLSWIDNCPNNVVEALSSNLFCVVSNEGGTKELINETCGKVFEVDPPFPYSYIDTNRPPTISRDIKRKIAEFMNKKIRQPKNDMKNGHVDIDNIAKEYFHFFEKVLVS